MNYFIHLTVIVLILNSLCAQEIYEKGKLPVRIIYEYIMETKWIL